MTAQAKTETWTTLCTLDDLVPDSGVAARLDGQQIALFYLPQAQRVYALDNGDPFSGANVIARGIVGDLKERRVVASPLYKQHFCLDSGECLEDDGVRLRTWPARIAGERVQIATS